MLKNAALALLIFLALYLLSRTPGYAAHLWRRIRYRDSATWPIYQAVIQEQRIETKRGSFGGGHQAVLIYSYNIGGHSYSGCYRSDKFVLEVDAQRLLTKYPVNSSVMARVSPKKSTDSTLVLPE